MSKKNMLSTPINHVACESKLRPVVRSSMHPCLRNRVAIRLAVVYYARAAHAFSAGIICRHRSLSSYSSTLFTQKLRRVSGLRKWVGYFIRSATVYDNYMSILAAEKEAITNHFHSISMCRQVSGWKEMFEKKFCTIYIASMPLRKMCDSSMILPCGIKVVKYNDLKKKHLFY